MTHGFQLQSGCARCKRPPLTSTGWVGKLPHMNIRTRAVTNCPVCGGAGRARYQDLEDRAYGVPGCWEIIDCLKCGSGWLNPAPLPEDIGQCYVGSYYTHERPEAVSLGKSRKAALARRMVLSARKGYTLLRPPGRFGSMAGSILACIPSIWSRACLGNEDMLPAWKPGGRLLEIGCGAGQFLGFMQLLGWRVCGIELDPVAAGLARTALACNIHTGTIEDAQLEDESFDVVVSSHVIEHVFDPASFVARAGRLLKRGGTITTLTPNYGSVGHKAFGSDWYCLDPPRHLCLFTPKSLQALFAQSGLFGDIRTRTITRASRLVMRRRLAVRATGQFLGDVESKLGARISELLFRAMEAAGNPFLRWGEEIRCVARRS